MLSLLSGLLHAQDTVADFFIVKLHLAPGTCVAFSACTYFRFSGKR